MAIALFSRLPTPPLLGSTQGPPQPLLLPTARGVLLLFMSELHDGLPLAVACSEAVALSKAYSGAHHTMVNGVLAAYAQDMKSRGLEVDTS